MKSIDYLSIFLLLGSAPTWQGEIDRRCPGLGSALLIMLVLAALHLVRNELGRNGNRKSINGALNSATQATRSRLQRKADYRE